jgi:Iron/manganese superoxide dismutases, alpha-hairpin domain
VFCVIRNPSAAAPLTQGAVTAYEIPPLPYDHNALEPYIAEETVNLHHEKDHQAYVTNANKALDGTDLRRRPLTPRIVGVATQVIVQPPIDLSTASAKVVSFKRGTQSASKTVGQVPTDYKEGSGTIVSGNAATKATKAALTSYAGGIVDRVVHLSNGEYEVHYIGVNWPHHIFVTRDFKVVGAN